MDGLIYLKITLVIILFPNGPKLSLYFNSTN